MVARTTCEWDRHSSVIVGVDFLRVSIFAAIGLAESASRTELTKMPSQVDTCRKKFIGINTIDQTRGVATWSTSSQPCKLTCPACISPGSPIISADTDSYQVSAHRPVWLSDPVTALTTQRLLSTCLHVASTVVWTPYEIAK